MNIKPLLFFLMLVSQQADCNQPPGSERSSRGGAVATEYTLSSRSMGKPHAPVSMRYVFNSTVELNEPLGINLTFTVERETQMLEVAYTIDSDLRSLDAAQQFQFTQLIKGSQEQVTIEVVPQQGGLHYINVFATITINGMQQTRAFAIPVSIAGEATQLQKNSQNEPPANGMRYLPQQNVISMPANEPP